MADLTAWSQPTGPVRFDVDTRAGETKLTMTVTTDDGDIYYITTTARRLDLWALAESLLDAAERTRS